MVLKLENQWKHFWRTCTSQGTVSPYAPLLTIGASTMIYPSNHPPPLRQHPFRFSHIPNTPTSMFHNRMKRYRTSFTFYNHAGDVRLNIIHKVPLFLCLGHHGDLHHLHHHRQHFTGPYTRITLPHLFIILIVHYLRTNLALWICLTPVCNTPLPFAKRKKTECRRVTLYCVPCFVLLPCHAFRFSIYCNQQYSYLQPGLNAWNSTPWLTLLVLTHIALHPGLIHHRVLELLHGLLDIEAFLVMWTLLHTDPS